MIILYDSLATRVDKKELVKLLLVKYPSIFKHSTDYNDLSSNKIIIFHDNASKVKTEFKKDKWLIEYSGAISLKKINDEKYGSLPADKLFANLEKFLERISGKNTINIEDFNVLFDFDPKKEASIYLWKSLNILGIKMKRNYRIIYTEEINAIKENSEFKNVTEVLNKINNKFSDSKSFADDLKQLQKDLFPQTTQS